MSSIEVTDIVQDEAGKKVLAAAKEAAKRIFFQTNEFITKRLVSGQYHLYADLAAFTTADVRLCMDDGTKASIIDRRLTQLTNAGVLVKKNTGKINLYWFADTAYLKR